MLSRVLTQLSARYNYVLSGALDIGTALCIVISGLALGLSNTEFPSWWGNDVFVKSGAFSVLVIHMLTVSTEQ